ncbi:MAG: tetratricopeptide repeat protein [Deltaproteobacteria bacterium]|nr:tetratricopeptide repeat protein [Deltaproteobacteria bacterium]
MSALMEAHEVKRKLVAIFAADVQGYSRLMGEDEEATLRTLNAYRKVTDFFIEQHNGRVVNTAGDSILAEFASVVDAVRCAVEIQQELKIHNAALPAHRRMAFRIGINLGDVMVEGEQIYGDGVNIAARLEALAEPSGICISATVYEQIENKLSLQYESLGEQGVKNIAKPVRVWRIRLEEFGSPASSVRRPTSEGDNLSRVGIAHRSWVMATAAGLLLIAGIFVAVQYLFFSPNTQSLAPSTQAEPALPLPDKPSIVVLPFVNMSEDPKQEYFSDGMTEDLITDLSKLSGLFVIARNSAFIYKGKVVKVEEVGRELGVRYVLEGSVRKMDSQIRITAQLVDATTGGHLWAERYDRPLKDIFALQDEIRQKIITALRVKLTKEEQERFKSAPTDNLEAYDYYLRGAEYFSRQTKDWFTQARQMFEKAIELDEKFAGAYAALSWTSVTVWYFQWSPDPQTLERSFTLAQRAVALDDSLPTAHGALGLVYLLKKQHDQSIVEAERAIALDPNSANAHAMFGFILNWVGRAEETIGLIEKAMRLNPHYPSIYLIYLGQAYRLTGRYEEAIAVYKKALARNPDFPAGHLGLAATYSELGREAEAQAETAEVLRISPHYSLEIVRQRWPYKDPAVLEHELAAMRKAGLK